MVTVFTEASKAVIVKNIKENYEENFFRYPAKWGTAFR